MRTYSTSVAIATYNGEKYILQQLESIENQTVLPNEVVICDDCSNDNTINLVNNYSLQSKLNIIVVENDNNLGFRKNFEKAVTLCSCDIVFFCDQDDVWVSNKIQTILDEFEKDNFLVYAFSNAYVVDVELNIIKENEWGLDWTKFNRQEFFDYTQTRNFPLGFQVAAKRDFLNQITPFLSDHDGWVAQCAPLFGNVKAIPQKLVYYRRHEGAVSGAHKTKKTGYLALIKRMIQTEYQVYFVYPNAELKTYSQILKYAKLNNGVNTKEIEEHIGYLRVVNDIQSEGLLSRIKSLKSIKDSGLYSKYRGNNKTYFLDIMYLIVNYFRKI